MVRMVEFVPGFVRVGRFSSEIEEEEMAERGGRSGGGRSSVNLLPARVRRRVENVKVPLGSCFGSGVVESRGRVTLLIWGKSSMVGKASMAVLRLKLF
jgi:hypothetical protein